MADVIIKPIRRLLVANRGEIARRIFRTAQRMGIATVAVYADGDAGSPHVREADTAIALNGRSPAETYLDVGKLLEACRRTGADAVHPGYGFLSENAGFAQAVIDQGIAWVGPTPATIRGIGDKLAAKRLMQTLNVPTLQAHALAPGEDAAPAALRIGYPVLVKAAAGGGGRGMRVVDSPADLEPAIASARREASAAFGDGTLFLERWVARSRHVEIQILGDSHGQLVHLFERECSIQRRHQKIIEEAPSPALDAALREQMGQAALTAARAIGYQSAGTVEFLLSGREFWFLEVNTRLQVEHPVTEAITGLDLVREQLRIAEGEPLGYTQSDLRIDGHAIEARLCAENPAQGFLPTPGTIDVWAPATGEGVRFDSGVESGSEVSIDFDTMIAKVIVKAPTRREAASRLARVLETTRLQGITHNRDFLVSVLRSPEFLRGDTHTDFIERVAPARERSFSDEDLALAATAAALQARALRRTSAKVLASVTAGFRNSVMPPERVDYLVGDRKLKLEYRAQRDGSLVVSVDGCARRARVLRSSGADIDLEVDGRRSALAITSVGARRLVHGEFGDVELIELPRFAVAGPAQAGGALKAPMPGRVLAISVAPGESVVRGQLLMVLEAMKMEHRITAPADGIVQAIRVAEGEQVANGALLAVLDDQPATR
ncbi:MAG: ATP-grasp domain-containing protein [Betaproteobacteria bacterium]|nr:ATP-grasp domain-containing protein [Betaproteobacteria bacterium]